MNAEALEKILAEARKSGEQITSICDAMERTVEALRLLEGWEDNPTPVKTFAQSIALHDAKGTKTLRFDGFFNGDYNAENRRALITVLKTSLLRQLDQQNARLEAARKKAARVE